MGTRAIIARRDPRSDGWDGIYLNNEGEPEHATQRIYAQVKTAFAANVEKAYDHFVSRHPGGWYRLGNTVTDNVCYCHPADRVSLGAFVASTSTSSLDWIYVLCPEGLEIRRWHRGTLALIPWRGAYTPPRIARALEAGHAAA